MSSRSETTQGEGAGLTPLKEDARQYTVYVYRANSVRPVLDTDSYVRARALADTTSNEPGVDYALVMDDRGFTAYGSGRRLF